MTDNEVLFSGKLLQKEIAPEPLRLIPLPASVNAGLLEFYLLKEQTI